MKKIILLFLFSLSFLTIGAQEPVSFSGTVNFQPAVRYWSEITKTTIEY